jgi:sec-independent protein translocase protein TatA
MGLGSIWHWLILGAVVLLLFGKGRISDIMSDFGKGIKGFKKGLSEDVPTAEAPPAPKVISNGQQAETRVDSKEDVKG